MFNKTHTWTSARTRLFKLLAPAYLGFVSLATASIPDLQVENFIEQGININLNEPTFSEGVLSTDQGGVISGPEMRIQAQKLTYIRKKNEQEKVEIIQAEENLLVEFGDYIFIGDSIEYNLTTETGIIHNGRTSVEPWFFGGRTIELLPNKSIIIHDGFVTTSADIHPEWSISTQKTTLSNKRYFTAYNVKFRIFNFPFFWLPRFSTDLSTIGESPIHYAFRFGGSQGPRMRMIYEIFSWDRFKAFLRFEYRLNRGPGAGFTTEYHSRDHKMHLETINYVARDSSIQDPNEKIRYRFQGIYKHLLNNDNTRINLCWDKLSDKDMAEDYNDETLTIYDAGRTELQIRHQERSWIANLFTTVQLNSFQTVKQEIPELEWRFHPISIGNSGVISETLIRAGYLDYDYASNLKNVHDYSSTRLQLIQNIYRPFYLGPIVATPEAGLLAMHYSNSPQKESRELYSGLFSLRTNTHIFRFYGQNKHVLEPYANYQYYTSPTTNPNDHFIFDIDDGWYRLNTLRFGLNNNFYTKDPRGNCVHRYLQLDLFTNAFFDTNTIPDVFQKVYAHLIFNSFRNLRHSIETAWNLQKNQLDYFNSRVDWTCSANLAIAIEFRHRGPYDWRKVDYDNFILDSFRSVEQLRHSQLSDRRDTLLLHTYYRFHPYWALEVQIRHGWNREFEPEYLEFQTDLITNLGSAWNLKLSYQQKEDEHRFSFYFTLGTKRPNQLSYCPVPCVEF